MKATSKKQDPALERHLRRALIVARAAAQEAGQILKKKVGRFRNLEKKADTSLVTEVDRAAEKKIVRAIRRAFPNDRILGEEGGERPMKQSSSFRWHIDPLDGTTNFVHGFPFFCVSIGLEFENEQLILGVIFNPISQDLYTAYRGGGAFLNGRRIQVSNTKNLEEALLTTGFSYKRQQYLGKELRNFSEISRRCRGLRRTGSAALDLATVATGQFDGFWEFGLASWDTAAGIALVQEAGGTVTQMNGEPYRLSDETILVTNGMLHPQLRKILSGPETLDLKIEA